MIKSISTLVTYTCSNNEECSTIKNALAKDGFKLVKELLEDEFILLFEYADSDKSVLKIILG